MSIPNFEYCSSQPEVHGGEITIHGTRLPVSRILSEIAAGFTISQIANSYGLEQDRIVKVINEISDWVSNIHRKDSKCLSM